MATAQQDWRLRCGHASWQSASIFAIAASKSVSQKYDVLTAGAHVQSASSRRGDSFFRQLSMQPDYATDADGPAAGLETVMWTRELAKRLLLPRADVEGLEDLLDTYFMLVRPFTRCKHSTNEFLPWHKMSNTVGTFAAAG